MIVVIQQSVYIHNIAFKPSTTLMRIHRGWVTSIVDILKSQLM
uniref:Uncharacterized protein n=1 Tax=Rhizophora mucronata TaxID=61149 RepID=A0A2P2PQ54_RHIMU